MFLLREALRLVMSAVPLFYKAVQGEPKKHLHAGCRDTSRCVVIKLGDPCDNGGPPSVALRLAMYAVPLF